MEFVGASTGSTLCVLGALAVGAVLVLLAYLTGTMFGAIARTALDTAEGL